MLGYAHPDIMLNELTSSQITEWMAYDRLEPIHMGEMGWAILCSVASNIAISIYGKKGSKYTKPADFMPGYQNMVEKKPQTVEEQKEILKRIASIQNKKFKKGVKKRG
jgi:hypothetical protein